MKDDYDIGFLRSMKLIHELILKSFNFHYSQIVISDKETITVNTSGSNSLNQINYDGTIYAECLCSQEIVIKQNVDITDLDEEIKFFASAPLFSNNNQVIGCLVIMDVRTRNFTAVEQDLFHALSKVVTLILLDYQHKQSAQEVFSHFVHKTVHDLKNPFTSISLTAELLKRKAEDGKMVSSLSDRIVSSSKKVFNILEQLKSSFPLNDEAFKLNIAATKTLTLFLDLQKTYGPTILLLKNGVEEDVFVDYARLKEAITLVVNHLLLLTDYVMQITLESIVKGNAIAVEISSPYRSAPTRNENNTTLAVARSLIEMQKGKLSFQDDRALSRYCYLITLPT